jgi:uncharacterized protein (TIGR02757 family)
MNHRTRELVEALYRQYHKPQYLGLDPVEYVRNFKTPADIEIAGLLASSLAYGKVETIRSSVSGIFEKTGNHIADFIHSTTFSQKRSIFRGFKHRFNDGSDIALFFESLRPALAAYGSLLALFRDGDRGADTVGPPLTEFVGRIRSWAIDINGEPRRSFQYLLPLPSEGSACKRLNMFLRWVVRGDDGIDLGIWNTISCARLIMPVDTHVAKAARRLHLTTRLTVDWRMAEEITAQLKKIDPFDPVKYDFSLCRWGMVDSRTGSKRK